MPPPDKQATRAIGRRPRMGRFLRVLVTITAIIHIPFALGVVEVLRRAGFERPGLLALALTALGVLFFIGRARSGMYDKRRGPLAVRLVDIPYFIHWCACVFTLVPALTAAILSPIFDLARGVPVGVPSAFFAGTYAMGLVVCGYGILVRRRFFRVEDVEVTIDGLAPEFDGYRIAHLSDLHIGTVTPQAWGERWTSAANGREPDLAVVTGDLVTSGTEFYKDVAAVIGSLRAKDGVFVSMGNHDYFGDGEPLVEKLNASGARVLRNEGRTIRRGSAEIYLSAIDDTWTRRDDIARALEGRPKNAPTILLAHDPERFREAAKRDVDLTLSGHTHGGQIAMPFFAKKISLSHLTHHFHLGLYKRGRSTLFVHPGLGTTGPPMRLGVAPAVVILTLRAAPS
jgi:predicted MPP superfamily phosphohydrolase